MAPPPTADQERAEQERAHSARKLRETKKLLARKKHQLKVLLAAEQALSPGSAKSPEPSPIDESSPEGAGDEDPEPQVGF